VSFGLRRWLGAGLDGDRGVEEVALGVVGFEVAGEAAGNGIGGEVGGEAVGLAVEFDGGEIHGGEGDQCGAMSGCRRDAALDVDDVAGCVEQGEAGEAGVLAQGVGGSGGAGGEVEALRAGEREAVAGAVVGGEINQGALEAAGDVEGDSGFAVQEDGPPVGGLEGFVEGAVGAALDGEVGGELDVAAELLLFELLLFELLAADLLLAGEAGERGFECRGGGGGAVENRLEAVAGCLGGQRRGEHDQGQYGGMELSDMHARPASGSIVQDRK
jgi:hypothetical protein